MTARYEEVARSLARQIESSAYPVGSRLPTEVDLAESYAVSRATVRAALETLERVGMISRRRRVGTIVEAQRPTSGFARTVTNLNDLVQYSGETKREVLNRDEIVADQELAAKLACDVGQRWTHLSMLRWSNVDDEAPLCHTDVYLRPEVADVVGDRVLQPDGLISEIVERTTGRLTVRVEQTVRATALTEELSQLLTAPVGQPALTILRSYVEGSGRVSQVTESVHPADRYEFRLSMQRHYD